jgi:uncharacterized protein (TIGR00290 family)
MRAVCSWSGGKDAAYALSELQQKSMVTVEGLLTTVSTATNRSSMHGVHRELYDRQADALGLPIEFVELPPEPTNEAYEEAMAAVMDEYANRGIKRVVFADLCLSEVRAYREERLADSDIEGDWPLWGRDTSALAADFIEKFRATVVCVDGEMLDSSFAGREFDTEFLADLPNGVDPCGENGEFHTFVWNGPIFEESVAVRTGETVTREVGDGEFHYCDLLLCE